MTVARRIPLWITEAEADAVLNILLQAPPASDGSGEVTERLLCRVADAHRAFFQLPEKAALSTGRRVRRTGKTAARARRRA